MCFILYHVLCFIFVLFCFSLERTKTTHTLTPAAMLALGWKGKGLNGAELMEDMELHQLLSRVTTIQDAVEDMWAEGVILTEEYEELVLATKMSCQENTIRKMLSDPDIPVATKHSRPDTHVT